MPDAAPSATRLVAVDDFDQRQVTVVETPHGALAVGISNGDPFAVSTAVAISSRRSGMDGSLAMGVLSVRGTRPATTCSLVR